MPSVGNLVANLLMNTSGFSAGAKKAESDLQRLGSSLKGAFTSDIASLATRMTSALAPLALIGAGGAFAADIVGAAKESEIAFRTLDSVLADQGNTVGLTTQQIADYATELARVTNFEDDATVAATAMLATFKNISGETFLDAIAAAQDLATVTGQDLTSAMRIVGKALSDPEKGLKALKGQFTEAEREMLKTLATSGRLAEAQKIINERLRNGAAKAAADEWVIFTNNIGNVKEVLGGPLLSDFNKLLHLLNQIPAALKSVNFDSIKPPEWLTNRGMLGQALGGALGGISGQIAGLGVGSLLESLPSGNTPKRFNTGNERDIFDDADEGASKIDKATEMLDGLRHELEALNGDKYAKEFEKFIAAGGDPGMWREMIDQIEKTKAAMKADEDEKKFWEEWDRGIAEEAIKAEQKQEADAESRRKKLEQALGSDVGLSGAATAGSSSAQSIIANAVSRSNTGVEKAVHKLTDVEQQSRTYLEQIAEKVGEQIGYTIMSIGA